MSEWGSRAKTFDGREKEGGRKSRTRRPMRENETTMHRSFFHRQHRSLLLAELMEKAKETGDERRKSVNEKREKRERPKKEIEDPCFSPLTVMHIITDSQRETSKHSHCQ